MRLALIILMFALLVGMALSSSNRDRVWRAKKSKCEKNECSHLVPEEATNCVNKCTSEKCYGDVYASNPLEDGEIDANRSRTYVACLREEARLENKKKNES